MNPPLLPSQRYIASIFWPDLGPEEAAENYRIFQKEVDSNIRINPSAPTAGLETLAIIAIAASVISVGLTIVASFFKPKEQKPGSIDFTQGSPDNRTGSASYLAKTGFDSVQKPAGLGVPIPLVYCDRRYRSPKVYPLRKGGLMGGCRVAMPLLWSALEAIDGSLMLRALFMTGEGEIGGIDPKSFAIGDSVLSSYDLPRPDSSLYQIGNSLGSRMSVYWKSNGGRILSGDIIAGRQAATDPGNAMNRGGTDAFQIRGHDGAWRGDFCFTSKPNVSTSFGNYSLVPNNLGYRVAPSVRPTASYSLRENTVDMSDEPQSMADAWKSKYTWSGRSGIVNVNGASFSNKELIYVRQGQYFWYRLDKSTDSHTRIWFNRFNTDFPGGTLFSPGPNGESKCVDVGAGVASRQKSADEAMQIGEIFKAGSALAVVEQRVGQNGQKVFVSDGETIPVGRGNSMLYLFRVVRDGYVAMTSLADVVSSTSGQILLPPYGRNWLSSYATKKYKTATNYPQIFRCAIAKVSTPRAARNFEIGIRSSVGMRVNGLTNFSVCPSLRRINLLAGDTYEGYTLRDGQKLALTSFQSGVVRNPEERYSFFRLSYRQDTRDGGIESAWQELPTLVGVKSATSKPFYNSIRFQAPNCGQWLVGYEPVSGWEVRNFYDGSEAIILDGRASTTVHKRFASIPAGLMQVWITGYTMTISAAAMRLSTLEPITDIGYGWTDGSSMLDDWGRVAENFAYDQVSTTADNGPEHEIVYVNTITPNATPPQYDGIAYVGLNIRSSTEWSSFSQFSGGITYGRIPNGPAGPGCGINEGSLFGDIVHDIAINKVFGRGATISRDQLDVASLFGANDWCRDRYYFFDGLITNEPNFTQWLADTASTMLLDLTSNDGRYSLVPSINFDDPRRSEEDNRLPIRALFTAGNILKGTFELSYLDAEDRQPIQAVGKWRSERPQNSTTSDRHVGFFPVEKSVMVREASGSELDPIETFDLSGHVTNFEHVVDYLCYVIRVRRLIDHTVSFKTTPDGIGAGLANNNYIKVAMDESFYDQHLHGAILPSGEMVVSDDSLRMPGTFTAMVWDGSNLPSEIEITVGLDGTASPVNFVFVKKVATSTVNTYKITKLTIDEEGIVSVLASHHPVDSRGISQLGLNWTTYRTDANWIIQGDDPECLGALGSGGV